MLVTAAATQPAFSTGAQKSTRPAVRAAAEQFEAMFMSSFLQAALKDDQGRPLLGGGPGGDILQSLVQETLAAQVARRADLGVAEQMIDSFGASAAQAE